MQKLKEKGKQIIFAVAAILLVMGVVCGVVLNNNTQHVSKEIPIKVKVLGISESATSESLVNGGNSEEGEKTETTEISQIGAIEPEKADITVGGLNYANKDNTIRLELDGTDNFKVQNSTLTIDQIVVKVNGTQVNATKSFESGPEDLNDGQNGKKYVLALTNVTGDGILSIVIPANTLTDEAGNKNDEITSTFDTQVIIDNTAPTKPTWNGYFVDGSGDYTSGTWTNKEVKTTFHATDMGSGVRRFEYSVNDGTWMEGALAIPEDNNGGFSDENTWNFETGKNDNIKFRAIDYVGNVSTESDIFNVRYDNTAPTLSLSLNPTGYAEAIDINVTSSDTYSSIAATKYAKGNHDVAYFASNGDNVVNNTCTVTENGTYTVYVEDEAGNGAVATIVVDKIDKTAPVIEANNVFNGTSISFTAKDIAPDDNENPSGVVGYQITNSSTAPTSGWVNLDVPAVETVDGKKQTAKAVTISNSNLSVGTYYIWVIDAVGHKTSKEISVAYNVTFDYQDEGIYLKNFLDTGYTVDWSKSFRVEETFRVGELGQRYLLFGNYPTKGTLNLEVASDNKIRVFITDSSTNTAISDVKSSATIANNEDISLVFEWNSLTKKYSVTAIGTTTNITMNSDTINITRTAENTARVGQDYRDSTYETFKTLNVSAFRIIENVPNVSGIGTFPSAVKPGYTYNGWFTQATGGTQKTSFADLTTNETLYAQKTANTYSVKYNGNNSTSGSMNNSTHTYDEAKNLTANAFGRQYTVTYNHNYQGSADENKTGTYSFSGWATSANGLKTYDDGQSVINLSSKNNDTVNLYAVWTGGNIDYTPTRTGYSFGGWYTNSACSGTRVDTEGVYTPTANTTLYAKWLDQSQPVVDIEGGITPKCTTTAGQVVTLKGHDGEGITAYYWGTTEPTQLSDITTGSLSDLAAIQGESGLNKTINATGTYWFACRDISGNWDKKSITIISYTVDNLIDNIDGAGDIYTNANYTSAINTTYIIKDGTSLKLRKIGTLPEGAGGSAYQGYSTVYSTTPATLEPDPDATITLENGTTYYMWYNRRVFTITLTDSEKGLITAETVIQQGNHVTLPSLNGEDRIIDAKYGDSLRLTAIPYDGYTFTGWSGGYVSGTSNPVEGSAITDFKTVTASYTYTATPVITRTAYNTFSVSAPFGAEYIISKTQTTQPAAGANTWSTTTTQTTSTSAKETWYVWAKDSSGVVSPNCSTITNYQVTLTAGTGTTLTAKADGNTQSSPEVTSGMYVLNGTPVYPTGATSNGYNSLVIKNGDVAIVNSGSQTINANTTFTTSASENVVTINIKKDDVAWPASGIKVRLYNGSTPTDYTAIVSESGVSSATFTTVPNGTYKVYAGKESSDPENLIDSKLEVTVNNNSPSAITLDYYSLTLRTGNGVEGVLAHDIWSYVEVERQYLNTQQSINIRAYPEEGYTFDRWTPGEYLPDNFIATSEMQSIRMVAHPVTLTASAHDITAPEVSIDGGIALKSTSQTVALKGSDGVGITGYYWGTTEPTSAESCTTTTAADLSSINSANGLSQTISSTGTYWFACRDAAGNWDKTSITIVSYTVNNLLENIAGQRNTYTNANYTSVSSETYIVKSGRPLTIDEIRTVPIESTGATVNEYRGFSTTFNTTPASLDVTHTPQATNGAIYYIWFNRTTFTVTVNKNANGGIMAETVTLQNNSVSVASNSSSSKDLTVKYGDRVKVTAQANSGYTFTEWSGGYVSGTTNPKTGGQVTGNKTVTASFEDRTAPRIKVQAFEYSSTATNYAGDALNSEITFAEDGTYHGNQHWTNKGVTFKFTVYDEVGVTGATWRYNTAGQYTDTGDSYNDNPSTWSNGGTNGIRYLNLQGAGRRKAQYIVRDAAGNTTTVTVIAEIDKTAPTLSGTVTANIDSANKLTVKVAISSASDVGGGITRYALYDGDIELASTEPIPESQSQWIVLQNNTDWQTKDFVVKAIDDATNVSDGVPISYYTVDSVSGLNGLATCVNSATTSDADAKKRFNGRTVKQISTISPESTATLTPIGHRSVDSNHNNTYYGFEGTFDGQNYKITNVKFISSSTIYDQGLFGHTQNATIQNVDITLVDYYGEKDFSNAKSPSMGGIVAIAGGATKISNCTVSGTLNVYAIYSNNNTAYVGGICGLTQGTTEITRCTNNATINGPSDIPSSSGIQITAGGIVGCTNDTSKVKTHVVNNGTVNGYYRTGGIVGYGRGEISGCTNNGVVNNSSDYTSDAIGGIVGFANNSTNKCSITNCSNNETITAYGVTSNNYANAGGIVGRNDGTTISACTNSGEVCTKLGSMVGGIVGYNTGGTIQNSTNDNVITYDHLTDNEYAYMGGIAGQNYGGTISNCTINYSLSTMNFKIQRVGGVVGLNRNNGSTTAQIDNCNVINSVIALKYVGGVAGENNGGTIKNCIVDKIDPKGPDYTYGDAYIGGIAGTSSGTIEECQIKNRFVQGKAYCGGIVGNNTGTISKCEVPNTNELFTFLNDFGYGNSAYQYNGGIAGKNSGTITSSTCSANVGNQDSYNSHMHISNVGGIAGWNTSTGKIQNSTVNSEKIGGKEKVGGLVGDNEGEITTSGVNANGTGGQIFAYSTGSSSYVGGVAGRNNGTISKCYNRAGVGSTTEYSKIAGGITGGNASNGYIEYCYNTGSIYGGDDSTGGIAGANTGELNNCYNRGFVKNAPSNKYYGITGNNAGTWNNCYYLTGSGAPPNSNSIGTAKNETYLKTTLPSEWSGFFKQDKTPNINSGYAILYWE